MKGYANLKRNLSRRLSLNLIQVLFEKAEQKEIKNRKLLQAIKCHRVEFAKSP
jgi:hypothetical protein